MSSALVRPCLSPLSLPISPPAFAFISLTPGGSNWVGREEEVDIYKHILHASEYNTLFKDMRLKK